MFAISTKAIKVKLALGVVDICSPPAKEVCKCRSAVVSDELLLQNRMAVYLGAPS